FRATHASQGLFRRVHESRRNAMALELRKNRQLVNPPAYSIKSRQYCSCQSPFHDTNEKQLVLYQQLPPNDIYGLVPWRIVWKPPLPKFNHSGLVLRFKRTDPHLLGHSLYSSAIATCDPRTLPVSCGS